MITKIARKTVLFKIIWWFFTIPSFNCNYLNNKPTHLGSHPFPIRIVPAPGPATMVFIETNPRFPRAKPHSEAMKHTVLLGYWKPFVSGLVPSHNTSEERVCLVMTPHQDSPFLTHKEQHTHGTIEAHDMCRLHDRNTFAVGRKAVALRQIEYHSWASWAAGLMGGRDAIKWKFFFSPKNPGEITYTKTYILILVLSITEQCDTRIRSDHPEVCQLLILPTKVLIL